MRRQKTPALVNLAIYTTITIFLWIFFDVYRALKKPPTLDIDNKILEPINPNLDKNLLDEIYQSTYFDESRLENYVPIPNSISPEKISTESSKINQ